jgi:hypothetical protein
MQRYDLDGRRIIILQQPPLQYGGQLHEDPHHRVYTREHLPWGALPAWEDGGPRTVPLTDWTVQYLVDRDSAGRETGQIELYVHRAVQPEWARTRRHRIYDSYAGAYRLCMDVGCCARLELHELSGRSYFGISAARGAAYDAGLIGLRVEESAAERYGFRPEVA